MVDERIKKFANVLVNYSLKLKKGDLFVIDANVVSEPLIKAVYKEALLAGANPVVAARFEDLSETFYNLADEDQLNFVDPLKKLAMVDADAFLTIWGDVNTKSLSNIDPAKISKRVKAHRDIRNTYSNRMADGSLRWCGTQFPTNAHAMDAEMSLSEYEEFVFNACYLNTENPVKEWLRIHDEQQRIVDFLNTVSQIEVKSADTHLTLSTKGRKWQNCDGTVNFPDGEVFTSPVEDSINGHVRYSFPAIYSGREVEDIVLTFKDGKVVDAKAKKGEDFLIEMLNTDEGARYVGEFAIGTNYNIQKFTKNILFDEKIGGTIHIAVGAGMPELGSKNTSAIHWDMICDLKQGGEIYADGVLIYKDGKFIKQF